MEEIHIQWTQQQKPYFFFRSNVAFLCLIYYIFVLKSSNVRELQVTSGCNTKGNYGKVASHYAAILLANGDDYKPLHTLSEHRDIWKE